MNVTFKFRYAVKAPLETRYIRPSVLYARILVNSEAATDFSTGITLLPDHWDQRGQQAKPDCPNADLVNQKLARIKFKIDKIWGEFDMRDEVISAHDLKRMYLSGSHKPVTLAELLNEHLAELKSRVAVKPKGRQIVEETYNVYGRYTGNLLRYLNENKLTGLTAHLVDSDRMSQIEDWLHRQYAPAYAAKQAEYLKTTMTFGVRKKLLRLNPVATYGVTQDDSPPDLVFLVPDEIDRLRNTDFHGLPHYRTLANRLDRVRDAFLAMLAIGQHYTEYKAFVANPDQFLTQTEGILFFKKQRQKTGVWALAPVTADLERLIEKYGGARNLPILSNTKMNDYLKTVAAACGIDKNLTTKAARKTFADNHLNEQLTDADTTARMMGLTSTAYLKHYGQTDERRLIKKLKLSRKN